MNALPNPGISMHPLNLAFRYLLEMAALAAVGWWGWQTGAGALRWLLAAALPLIAATAWATFNVPENPSRAAPPHPSRECGAADARAQERSAMDQPQEKNWWGRNWKWFVPVGCLGSLILLAGLILLIVTIVFGVIKSSDVYGDAVARAKANSAVRELLGTPIEEGFFVIGSVDVTGSGGHADLAVPLSGPRAEATLYVMADKSAGRRRFTTLVLELDETAERLDLLE